jgi:NAD(P)-dependent dehydrogenase (short-subunit alcohol dehydrogenase family)
MPSILITGANRGLGLGFARKALGEGWRVFATCRKPDGAKELRALKGEVSVHRLDVADHATVDALARELGRTPIDVLVNNAGVYGGPRQSLGHIDYDHWASVHRINTMGPMKVVEALLDNVARSDRKLIVSISSYMGSIAQTGSGYYIYRSSKAALDMMMATLAHDVASKRIIAIAMSPGWVRTDMGGRSAPLGIEESVDGMWRVMLGATAKDSGAFLGHDGSRLPW